MSIVTITLGDKNFKLSCPKESKNRLEMLAAKLDCEIEEIKQKNPMASFELSLVITALELIDNKQSKAKETGGKALKKANQDFQKILTSVASELKTVAKKFEKC